MLVRMNGMDWASGALGPTWWAGQVVGQSAKPAALFSDEHSE